MRVQLEGAGSRLTISTRQFGSIGTDPTSALWKVSVSNDLHIPAELGISVVLNTDQEAITQLLEKPLSPKSKILADWLESEIRTAMLANFLLVQDRVTLSEEEFSEGSLGEAMLNLAEQVFPNCHILDMPRDPSVIMSASHTQARKQSHK